MSYIIDRDGKVVDAWYGYDEGEPKAIAALQKVGGELAEAVRRDMRGQGGRSRPTAVAAAAQRLFEAIRAADYDRDWIEQRRLEAVSRQRTWTTRVDRSYPGWVRWVCKKFKANPITDVQLGKVFAGPDGSPTVHFELHLKDGEILQGDLPFHWDSEKKQWIGWEGLDWHLQKKP